MRRSGRLRRNRLTFGWNLPSAVRLERRFFETVWLGALRPCCQWRAVGQMLGQMRWVSCKIWRPVPVRRARFQTAALRVR